VNRLIKILANSRFFKGDIGYHLLRASMVIIFVLFGYQKWFEYEAQTLSETRGFVKALVGDDDRILGFTAFGVEGSEMMAVVQTAMLGRLPYTALRDAIFTHPTSAEGLIGLFLNPLTAPVG